MANAPDIDALDPAVDDLVGTVIAERFRLDRRIGEGGSATVWAATHLRLDKRVALKLLNVSDSHTREVHERFLREARVAAAVRHRNVIEIIDFGTSGLGVPFMAMELLVGRSLADRIDSDDPMPVQEVIRHMARVLSGLGAVHDAGLVHRDVKPENIFLVEDEDLEYPKLIDFGISRALDQSGNIQSVLPTLENAIVGTPQYMSPEQARALPDLDHRSDIWSAGVIIFELMTGRLPFDADAVGDLFMQIATDEPPDFALLRPDLAGPIDRVIKRAMAKEPDDRYASAREMRAALLTAAAETAAIIHTSSSRDRAVPDTLDEPAPKDLLSAIGDAYEQGDSGLIDFSEHVLRIGTGSVPPPFPGRPPPPAPRRPADDPFPPATAEPVGTGKKLDLRIVAALAGLLLSAAAVTAAAVLMSGPEDTAQATLSPETTPEPEPETTPEPEPETTPEPEPETTPEPEPEPEPAADTITVTLLTIPRSCEVLVDGVPWEDGPLVTLPRDGSSHTFVVRANDGRRWTRTHVAEANATYNVVLPRRRGRRSRRRRRRLIREPGF